jgi:hypothetical protein
MRPPVALLIYPPQTPNDAVFYPFALFSPEWQALLFAFEQKIPARFMDLPQACRLALEAKERPAAQTAMTAEPTEDTSADPADTSPAAVEDDPLTLLATAAGYLDQELWWEHQIEQHVDPVGLFEGIMEAMTALRTHDNGSRTPDAAPRSVRRYEKEREAFMRQTIRGAVKEGFERIAVVCGAWHAPALVDIGPAKPDQELLRGMARVKVNATWVPWSHSRLAFRSGYGAGVNSPGWYEHLWQSHDRAKTRWAVQAARLLRAEGFDASSANVIETVRLADALAAFRDLPMAGLAEMNEALLTVLCAGDHLRLGLIRDRLEIADRLGTVPADTPTVPLQRDLEAHQKRLRLKPSTEIITLDLDLRKETDRERSSLLHQLRLLGINWGTPQQVTGKAGTFHELWQLQWQAEFVVALIQASVWGNTVLSATTVAVVHRADAAQDLPLLTSLLDSAVLAGLGSAVEHILSRLQTVSALATDIKHLMNAMPPLAQVARYGNVRGTEPGQVLPILAGLFARVTIGLPAACASLDDDAAGEMLKCFANVQSSLGHIDNASYVAEWRRLLFSLLDQDTIHGLVRGWCCRLLLEHGVMDRAELHRRARLALSTAVPLLQAGAWIQGLLTGSGMLVLHQDGLWQALDLWLSGLTPETFVEMLPLLRRAFADFQPPERRAMGEKVKRLQPEASEPAPESADLEQHVNRQRAAMVLPVLAQILGVEWTPKAPVPVSEPSEQSHADTRK